MPTLPDASSLGGMPTDQYARPLAVVDTAPLTQGAKDLGKGVSDLGGGLVAYGREQKTTADALAEAKATSSYLSGRVTLDDQLTDITDPDELKAHTPKYQQNLDAAAALIPDQRKQELFKLKYSPDVTKAGVSVSDRTDKLEADQDLATAHQTFDDLTKVAPKVNDQLRAAAIDTINTTIDKLQEDQRITAVQAQAMKKQWATQYLSAGLAGVQDPNDRLNLIRSAPDGKDGVLDRIGGAENATGNPAARAATSSAMGNFQFIKGTWQNLIESYRPDLANRSDAEINALRADPKLSREMAGHYYDEIGAYFQSKGIPQTPGNMYLGWFLGQGDAARVLKAPSGTPVSDVVNGQSITANPTILPGRTSDSVIAWANRKMGGVGAGGNVYTKMLPQDKIIDMQGAGQREADQQDRAASTANRTEIAAVTDLMKDDVSSIVGTGKPIAELTPERVGAALGSQAQSEFLLKREQAQKLHDATVDWSDIPEAEINARIEKLNPKTTMAGQPGYAQADTYYSAAKKAADQVIKNRADDPAGAVSHAPAVQAATQAVDPKTPASFLPVVKARMTAQAALGIAPRSQSPITAKEADDYTTQMLPLTKGQANVFAQNALIDGVISDVKAKYGDFAPQAMTQILSKISLSPEASYAVAAAVQKMNPLAAVTPAGDLPPAPAGVKPEGWKAVMSSRPLDATGKPMPADEWAAKIALLAKSPTETTVRMFNNSKFGRAGFDGAKILKQLAGAL